MIILLILLFLIFIYIHFHYCGLHFEIDDENYIMNNMEQSLRNNFRIYIGCNTLCTLFCNIFSNK